MRLLKYTMLILVGVFFVACNLDGKSKSVIVCTNHYYFGVYTNLSCEGDTKEIKYSIDKANKEYIDLYNLYHQGWKVDTDVSRANNFVFVLSK